MAENIQIVLPHGGYRKLAVYVKSETIYQGTVAFCRRFLPAHGDRTVDQMTQAARSCKQNIAEGSAASGTSKETEIKLTNVARATLDELEEDYQDRLRSHGGAPWSAGDERAKKAKQLGRAHADWDDWDSWDSWDHWDFGSQQSQWSQQSQQSQPSQKVGFNRST